MPSYGNLPSSLVMFFSLVEYASQEDRAIGGWGVDARFRSVWVWLDDSGRGFVMRVAR